MAPRVSKMMFDFQRRAWKVRPAPLLWAIPAAAVSANNGPALGTTARDLLHGHAQRGGAGPARVRPDLHNRQRRGRPEHPLDGRCAPAAAARIAAASAVPPAACRLLSLPWPPSAYAPCGGTHAPPLHCAALALRRPCIALPLHCVGQGADLRLARCQSCTTLRLTTACTSFTTRSLSR